MKQNLDEITKKLENGVKAVFTSEKYMEYLRFMSSFYEYSINNSILIWSQMPEATLVAGFKAWQAKGRTVKKGEKGIVIIAPCPHKAVKKVKDENGNEVEKEVKYTTFRAAYVFDISQTEGEDVPRMCALLEGDVDQFDDLVEKLIAVAPVPVEFKAFESPANGYFDRAEQKIVVQPDRSEVHKLKTLIHEIAHSILHCEDGDQEKVDRQTAEVQAESVAYTVCAALGLDTSDYSFGYVAGWSDGKDVKELTESMDVIRKTAAEILNAMKAA